MTERDIPVYVFTGFLDSGKTTFLNGVLKDGFARTTRTVLIRCEEGEEEYDEKYLRNVTVVTVENEEDLTPGFFRELEKKYRPKQCLVEYNGMWSLGSLDAMPDHWVLYQIMTFVESSTFDLYQKNFGQIMMEKIINSDMIVFNRATEELKAELRKRNIRLVNRKADIFFEDVNGKAENYNNKDTCPFDLSGEVTEIGDDEYGIWYVDVMDMPEHYEGKKLKLKMVMFHPKENKGTHCPGRFAMVCCAEDVQFMAVAAVGEKGVDLAKYNDRDWVEVTGDIRVEKHPAYKGGKGPVMHVSAIGPAVPPENDVVSF